jgi:hypothetical protein
VSPDSTFTVFCVQSELLFLGQVQRKSSEKPGGGKICIYAKKLNSTVKTIFRVKKIFV